MISVLFTVVKFFFVFQKLYYRFLLYIIYFFQFYFHFRGTLSYKLTKNRKLLLATFFCLSMWVRWFNCQSCAVFFSFVRQKVSISVRFACMLLVCIRTHTFASCQTRFQCECVSAIVLVEKEVDFIKICVFSSYIFHLFWITFFCMVVCVFQGESRCKTSF